MNADDEQRNFVHRLFGEAPASTQVEPVAEPKPGSAPTEGRHTEPVRGSDYEMRMFARHLMRGDPYVD